MKNFFICSVASLINEGKVVAFVKGNRNVNRKNICSKKRTLKDYHGNMTPLLYVDGLKAISDGCSLFNPETKKDIPNSEAENCIVILDGQHRYMAALESKLDLNNLIVYKDYTKASTKELLSVTNTDSFSWNGGDMVKGASLFSPENEVAQFASQLVDKGYSHSTIGYILCFAGGKLTKTHYSRIMRGEMIEVEYNVKRAEDFLNSARKIFDDKFIKMRYLISAIADLTNKSQGDYSKWLVALEQLDEDDKNSIKKASSDNKNSEIKEALRKHLPTEQN
jgi:hypothetical protein